MLREEKESCQLHTFGDSCGASIFIIRVLVFALLDSRVALFFLFLRPFDEHFGLLVDDEQWIRLPQFYKLISFAVIAVTAKDTRSSSEIL
jgi:hypothetical protein